MKSLSMRGADSASSTSSCPLGHHRPVSRSGPWWSTPSSSRTTSSSTLSGCPIASIPAAISPCFKDSPFPLYFLNSLIVTVLSLFLIMLFGSFAAYGCVRWRVKVSRWIYLFFIAGLTVPIKIGSINLLLMMKNLGLLDTYWSVIPVYVAAGMPIALLILFEFIRSIPPEFTEAAVMDGAGSWRIFSSIILHLVRPALATVAIFNLVPVWNDLWFPLIFIRQDTQRTLMLGVTRLWGQYYTDWAKILAVLSLSCVPVLILYLSMAKQFISSLTAGAIKG